MRVMSVRFVALAAILALVATGCAKKDSDTGADSKKVARVSVKPVEGGSGKYAFDGVPATLKAGATTFTLDNSGAKEEHEMQLIHITGGKTIEDVKKLFADETEGTPIPEFITGGGGPAGVKAGKTGSATVNLVAGKWAYFCLISPPEPEDAPDHWEGGMVGEFTVTGSGGANLPTAPAKVTMKDYSFEVSGLKAGTNTFEHVNEGKELHHALMAPIAKGKTFADVEKFIASQGEGSGPPPIDFASMVGTTVLDAGETQVVTLDIPAGSYAFICFINDRAGGPPHVTKGMALEVKVA